MVQQHKENSHAEGSSTTATGATIHTQKAKIHKHKENIHTLKVLVQLQPELLHTQKAEIQ
jgi:hypothetical protein